MRFRARVEIDGLPGIADPEGLTIERALPALNFSGVSHVHVGKVITFDLDAADLNRASIVVREMCDRLLVNPVIERSVVMVEVADDVAS